VKSRKRLRRERQEGFNPTVWSSNLDGADIDVYDLIFSLPLTKPDM
jgi:hypothetical protein